METRVAEILRRKGSKIITAVPEQSIASLVCQLNVHHIGAAPVIDREGHVIGMISERDIVRGLVERGGTIVNQPVSSLMSPIISMCTKEDKIGDVLEMITRNRTRHVPVVKDGVLEGLVSIGDIVTQLLIEAEYETQSLRHYIMSP